MQSRGDLEGNLETDLRWTEENLEDDKGNLGLERELEQELER